MRRCLFRLLGAALIGVLALGCGTDGDQTGVPQPVPIPKPSELRVTGSSDAVDVDVIGLPGAVSAAGRVEIRGPNGSASAQSTDAGTFFVMVRARQGDVLEVKWEGSQPAKITVGAKKGQPASVPEAAIDKAQNGLFTLTVMVGNQLDYIIANTRSGDVVRGTGDGSGNLTFTIRASSGDELRIYSDALDVTDSSLADPFVLIVP